MQAGLALAGRYVLDELLGQGAVGEVWRARDRELGRAVAVKVIRECGCGIPRPDGWLPPCTGTATAVYSHRQQ